MMTSSPSLNATARKPSHLGSYCHASPRGSSDCTFASIGVNGGMTPSCTPHILISMPSPTAVVQLRDTFGRIADDLRISVTDRCNFRCVYCMPAAGLPWLAREEVLTFEEIVRLTRILVERSGGRTIRLTGGEPLVRKGIEDLTRMIAAIDPSLDIAMTTNGILLEEKAAALRAAGL